LLRAGGAGIGRHTGDRQAVVLGEVTGRGTHGTERLGEAAGGGFGDVFVEGARSAASQQNALDRLDVEGAVNGRVRQGRV
jgi:hypothetical protein